MEMNPSSYSLNYTDRTKDYYPINVNIDFENDIKTIILAAELHPGFEYEFMLTNGGFQSKDGYPMKDSPYTIRFKTK
ncbi:MAG: hypothetical protein MUF28_10370 [Ignavibacterium sp.]|jgi:hypothetical protein|nr:hypothetical protein [Ignavibacterium sp.]